MREQRDLRAFAIEAAARPELGGITYSVYAGQICRSMKAVLAKAKLSGAAALPYQSPEDPGAYSIRNEAFQRAVAACTSYTADELVATDRSRWNQLAGVQTDVLHQLSGRSMAASKSEDVGARAAVLQAVLDNGDPLLLHITLDRLIEPAAATGLLDGLAVDTDKDREAILRAAFEVVPCRLGLICDSRTAEVLAACLKPQSCVDDRIQLARGQLAPDLRPAFDGALVRLEAAIRLKQASKLLP